MQSQHQDAAIRVHVLYQKSGQALSKSIEHIEPSLIKKFMTKKTSSVQRIFSLSSIYHEVTQVNFLWNTKVESMIRTAQEILSKSKGLDIDLDQHILIYRYFSQESNDGGIKQINLSDKFSEFVVNPTQTIFIEICPKFLQVKIEEEYLESPSNSDDADEERYYSQGYDVIENRQYQSIERVDSLIKPFHHSRVSILRRVTYKTIFDQTKNLEVSEDKKYQGVQQHWYNWQQSAFSLHHLKNQAQKICLNFLKMELCNLLVDIHSPITLRMKYYRPRNLLPAFGNVFFRKATNFLRKSPLMKETQKLLQDYNFK